MRRAVALDPRRTVRRRALIVLVPAILYPLIDAAAHIIQPKRIWLKAPDLDRLLGGCDVGAILAIGHARFKLVAPPVLCLRSSARSIFPFGFARESICLSRRAREPSDKLFGIAPAHVRDGRVILAGSHETACLRGCAFVPLADSHGVLADRKRLDRDLVSWLLCYIVIAPHYETTASNWVHLGLSDRRHRLCGGRGRRSGLRLRRCLFNSGSY